MKALDVSKLVKLFEKASTLEDQRTALAEIAKVINKRTEEEKEKEKAEKAEKDNDRFNSVDEKDLISLASVKRAFSKSEIQYLAIKTYECRPEYVESFRPLHIKDIAKIIGNHDDESWKKLDEKEQKSLIDKASPVLKSIREKASPIMQKFQSRKGFTGRRFSTRVEKGAINHMTVFRKEYSA